MHCFSQPPLLISVCLFLWPYTSLSSPTSSPTLSATPGAVIYSGDVLVHTNPTSDGYTHFRMCELNTAYFGCVDGEILSFGMSWYGAPSTDPAYGLCQYNHHCDAVAGYGEAYIRGQCEGQQACELTITNSNLGGDPCYGILKIAGFSLQCVPEREVGFIGDATYIDFSPTWYTEYDHFRMCENSYAFFWCREKGKTLTLGVCWYGAPAGDTAYGVCTGSGSDCNGQVGACKSYIGAQCNGKQSCIVEIKNSNIWGGGYDGCYGNTKFAALALKCD